MGAWGERPYQNDDACDFLGELGNHCGKAIDKAIAAVKPGGAVRHQYKYMTAIAAVQFLVDHCAPDQEPNLQYFAHENGLFGDALRSLDIMLADVPWLAQWDTPNKVASSLKALRRAVIARRRAAARADAKSRACFALGKAS